MAITWSDYPVENVRLTDLVLRKDIQPRGAPGHGVLRGSPVGTKGIAPAKGKFIPRAVNRYANRFRNGEIPPPVLVGRYRGKLLLLDGFQRFEAARIAGVPTLPARIAPVKDLKQARWEAIVANLDNGEPLAPKIKRHAFKVYISAGDYRMPHGSLKSYREISTDLGGYISKATAFRYMKELYPEIADQIAYEHGIGSHDEEGYSLAPGGCNDLPPVISIHEDLIQGVREAITTAIDEARNDADFRETLVAMLSDILTELQGGTDG